MLVIQLLQPFLFAVNIEGVEPALPDSVARVAVNGRRQAQPRADSALFPTRSSAPRQRLPAPGMLAIPAERRDDPLGCPLLQLLHEAAGALSGFGLDEKMKVLWHEDPADQPKAHLLPKLLEHLDKVLAETLALEELGAAISACGNELQLSGEKMPPVNGHDGR